MERAHAGFKGRIGSDWVGLEEEDLGGLGGSIGKDCADDSAGAKGGAVRNLRAFFGLDGGRLYELEEGLVGERRLGEGVGGLGEEEPEVLGSSGGVEGPIEPGLGRLATELEGDKGVGAEGNELKGIRSGEGGADANKEVAALGGAYDMAASELVRELGEEEPRRGQEPWAPQELVLGAETGETEFCGLAERIEDFGEGLEFVERGHKVSERWDSSVSLMAVRWGGVGMEAAAGVTVADALVEIVAVGLGAHEVVVF
jgi:hypothetical protein